MNGSRVSRRFRLTLTSRVRRRITLLLGVALAIAAFAGPTIDSGARALAAKNQDDKLEAARRAAAARAGSVKHIKMIMIGMLNYHDTNKRFPAAFTSKDGKPLLSWRVALLPYLEDESARELSKQFHLDEPWDSAHNKTLIAKMPDVYQSPASELNDGRTVYLTPRADFTAFPGDQAVPIRKIVDGMSKTIALVEVDDPQAVPWTKPDDWKVDLENPKAGFDGQYENGLNAAFVDGSVHFVAYAVDEKLLKALLTIDGGEDIRLPF